MHKDQRGLGHLVLIIVVLVTATVAAIGYRIYSNGNNGKDSKVVEKSSFQQSAGTGCQPASAGLFISDFTDVANITVIQTPIRLVGGNNIKTHSFVEVSKKSPVYAPMDATLKGGANYYETMGETPVTKVQYILSFNDGCDVSFWLDHIVDVPDKIKAAFPAEPRNDTQNADVKQLDIKAGELIGYSNQEGRARFDFGAINLKGLETSLTTNPRFKDDPIVKTSDKYRYATCPYKLYGSDKQKVYQLLYDANADGDQEIIDNICE